ncbi:MAG: hypothetical protein IJW69_01855 [Clostridia bacterium]|nr:hypothetical protein [Clostridia bacterium]
MGNFGIYEHVVTREAGRGTKLGKALVLVLLFLGIIGLLWLGLVWKVFPLFLGISVAAAFLAFLMFRRYSSLEYEYTIAEGFVTFAEIYGKSARRTVQEVDVRACVLIAPEDDARLAEYGAEDTYYAISSPEAENVYGIAFESAKGKKTVVYFEATDQALRMLRASNPRATVMGQV